MTKQDTESGPGDRGPGRAATTTAESLPLDIETMRTAVRQMLDPEAELPSYDEVESLTLLYRGNLMLLIPEVQGLARPLPKNDIPRACALACVGEARIRLDMEADPGLPGAIKHAKLLARTVNALCDHLENLGGERP